MIARIWHGYTTLSAADAYERLLKHDVFTSIEENGAKGYLSIQLLKWHITEVAFTTIMLVENPEAVKAFAGDRYEPAYLPSKARELRSGFDKNSIHCEMLHELCYDLQNEVGLFSVTMKQAEKMSQKQNTGASKLTIHLHCSVGRLFTRTTKAVH